jgi:hypothetical protein
LRAKSNFAIPQSENQLPGGVGRRELILKYKGQEIRVRFGKARDIPRLPHEELLELVGEYAEYEAKGGI